MKLHLTIFAAFICLQSISAQSESPKINRTTILQDEYIKVEILYREEADITQSNWLQLEIKNKSDSIVYIEDMSYIMDVQYPVNGSKSHTGCIGTKYDLVTENTSDGGVSPDMWLPFLYPGSGYYSSRNISTKVSTILPAQGDTVRVRSEMRFDISYSRDKIKSENLSGVVILYFNWSPLALISNELLVQRLKNSFFDTPLNLINPTLFKTLSSKKGVLDLISNEELSSVFIKGSFILRMGGQTPLIMDELIKRNAVPNPELTNIFTENLKRREFFYHQLFQYWDNSLLDHLLSSRMPFEAVARTLDIHAKKWSVSPENRKKVYNYLYQKTLFENYPVPNSKNFSEWKKAVKTIAISRDSQIIQYLTSLLDNEQSYTIDDLCKYNIHGKVIKDTFSLRVCDVAYIALLRATCLTDTQCRIPDLYLSVTIELPVKFIAVNPPEGELATFKPEEFEGIIAEKMVRLTPSLKTAIKDYVTALK